MNNKFEERTKGLAQFLTHRVALKTFGLGFASMALICFGFSANAGPAEARAEPAPTKMPATIPWSQLGAKAGAGYKGDGLAVVPTAEGARLRCVFQRLEGEATREGLWLSSTASNTVNDRFRVTAISVGRSALHAPGLPATGHVSLVGQTVRFIRPGLIEEYSISMDGVRQDFVLPERPGGEGKLAVRLAVSGAAIEPATEGARLVLESSKRKIAYTRLRAIDATGKGLTARMEILKSNSEIRIQKSEMTLVVLVDDANAVYPVRIDPTFSDANWISISPSIDGADGSAGSALATVVDGSGNLYIGGGFTVVGDVIANHIAKWNGSSWSALGSGLNSVVFALAVSGSDVYAGGDFTTAVSRPQTSPNGMGAVGARWGRGWTALCLLWRCRAATCMRGAGSRQRAVPRPRTSPNGTGAVGVRSVRG